MPPPGAIPGCHPRVPPPGAIPGCHPRVPPPGQCCRLCTRTFIKKNTNQQTPNPGEHQPRGMAAGVVPLSITCTHPLMPRQQGPSKTGGQVSIGVGHSRAQQPRKGHTAREGHGGGRWGSEQGEQRPVQPPAPQLAAGVGREGRDDRGSRRSGVQGLRTPPHSRTPDHEQHLPTAPGAGLSPIIHSVRGVGAACAWTEAKPKHLCATPLPCH